MAYQKNITTASGYEAGYWRLTEWSINRIRQGGECLATLRPYKDEATARNGGQPASEQVAKVRIAGPDFVRLFGADRDRTKTDEQIIYEAAADLGVHSDFGEHDGSTSRRKLFRNAPKV